MIFKVVTIIQTRTRSGSPVAVSRGDRLFGETDELGFHVTKDRIHVHDLQATILHLLGVDRAKLTFRFQGRDFRLTDVAGEIAHKLLA